MSIKEFFIKLFSSLKKEPEEKIEQEKLSEYFYLNEQGLTVYTEKYLLERGYCCENGCKHCPYGYKKPPIKK